MKHAEFHRWHLLPGRWHLLPGATLIDIVSVDEEPRKGLICTGDRPPETTGVHRLYATRRRLEVDIGKEFPYMGRCCNSEMTMITSRLTSKAQTTIPAPVRAALRLRGGDELAYSIERGRVVLTKAARGAIDEPFATFDEWTSDADREAYAGL